MGWRESLKRSRRGAFAGTSTMSAVFAGGFSTASTGGSGNGSIGRFPKTGPSIRGGGAKGWISRPCRLTVVPVLGWNRAMTWENTGLRWVPTSPNIPKPSSPRYYAATGIFGSLSGGDIGIGTDGPFEYVGGPGFDANEFTNYLQSLRLPGVKFAPYTRNSFGGSRVQIDPRAPVDLAGLNLIFIDAVNRRIGSRNLFVRTTASNKDVFYKVYGSTSLESDLPRGVHPAKIIASWQSSNESFRRARHPYLIYE